MRQYAPLFFLSFFQQIGGSDSAFRFEDLLPPPDRQLDALSVIQEAEDAFGGCAGFCSALESDPGRNCPPVVAASEWTHPSLPGRLIRHQ